MYQLLSSSSMTLWSPRDWQLLVPSTSDQTCITGPGTVIHKTAAKDMNHILNRWFSRTAGLPRMFSFVALIRRLLWLPFGSTQRLFQECTWKFAETISNWYTVLINMTASTLTSSQQWPDVSCWCLAIDSLQNVYSAHLADVVHTMNPTICY